MLIINSYYHFSKRSYQPCLATNYYNTIHNKDLETALQYKISKQTGKPQETQLGETKPTGYSHCLSSLSNNANTFLKSHSFWKAQPLILGSCIDIDVHVAFLHRCPTLLAHGLGLRLDTT